MLFSELIQAAQYKIVEGSEYQWQCYGSNARLLDFSADGNKSGLNCVFDSENQTLYEVVLYPDNNVFYRWINPDYIEKVKKEYKERNLDFNIAIDNIQWTTLENKEDVLRKTTQIITTGQCDDDVTIVVDLPKEELYKLCLKAHKENMTLNDYLIKVALEEIPKEKKSPKKKTVKKSKKV